MKHQYLGDSKDSFTWDYLDHLMRGLGSPLLNIALMMTPDDQSNEGNTCPTRYPAKEEVIALCHHLRANRKVTDLELIPSFTDSGYSVQLHQHDVWFDKYNREQYFDSIDVAKDQVLFLDPDNGFEPQKSLTEKHVRYVEVARLLDRVTDGTVVTVFQHHRRKKFSDDYRLIRDRLGRDHSTALYWHAAMFVAFSKSPAVIDQVRQINRQYAQIMPVQVID